MASRRMIQEAAPVVRSGACFETRRLVAPLLSTRGLLDVVPSASGRGRGDLGEQRQNMQLAIEIELFRLALRFANAVP
jgi:hypothetical protein